MENVSASGTALLVIDVQQGLFQKSTPIYKADALLENINRLVDRARHAGAPVIFIQHSNQKTLVFGSAEWQLHPRLQPAPEDCILHKLHGNAFEATELDEILKSRQIAKVIVTGLVTSGCVRATCLGALELGFRVMLVQDAHSSYQRQAAALIEEWNQKLAAQQVELLPAAEIAFEGDQNDG